MDPISAPAMATSPYELKHIYLWNLSLLSVVARRFESHDQQGRRSSDRCRSRHNVLAWQCDYVKIITNDQGNRTIPSYIVFTDTKRLIDDAAKNQVAMDIHLVTSGRSKKAKEAFYRSMPCWYEKLASIGGDDMLNIRANDADDGVR